MKIVLRVVKKIDPALVPRGREPGYYRGRNDGFGAIRGGEEGWEEKKRDLSDRRPFSPSSPA